MSNNAANAKAAGRRDPLQHIGIASAAALALGLAAGSAHAASPTIIVQWNNVTLQGIRDTHPGPPIVARMLAMVDTAMYDAWTAYDAIAVPTQISTGVVRAVCSPAGCPADKQVAISYAAYRTYVDLFPTDTGLANTLMSTLGLDPAVTTTNPSTPAGIGNLAASLVLAYRHHDGANQLGDLHAPPYSDYSGYVAKNTPDTITDPNHWQPLRVSNGAGGTVVQKFIAPFWGSVKPFGTLPTTMPRGPNLFGSAGYKKDVDTILGYSASLNDTRKVIAEYWADGPKSELPPGHWSLFAGFVSARDGHSTDDDAKLFFAQSNAIFDASIYSWGVKRKFDSIRPVSAVHFLKAGQMVYAWAGPGLGTRLIRGEDWEPFQAATVVTPPFPAYLSGHSIFSAAGAEVLKSFTGSDAFGFSVSFAVGSSRVEPGITPATVITLSYPSFTDAAVEAGVSRRYGGIHIVFDDFDSRTLGRQIGASDWLLAQTYFGGTATPRVPGP